MLEVVASKVLESAAGAAVAVLHDALKRKNDELLRRENQPLQSPKFVALTPVMSQALAGHIDTTRTWCSSLSFSDLKSRKSVLEIYVDLDTFLMPLSTHASSDERDATRPLIKALEESSHHSVLLGNPGAGKTTSLQKICADYFQKGKALLNYNFPILVRLRDLATSTSRHPLFDRLQEILAVRVEFPKQKEYELEQHFQDAIFRESLTRFLDELGCLLLLDGFDEIADKEARSGAISDIEDLVSGLRRSKIVITSRSREFRYKLGTIEKYELAPLTRAQIRTFAMRWLNSEERAHDFLDKIYAGPFADTAIRPLTIAHLCAIYERIGKIPEKPKSVYRKIVNLLLEEWDSQRGIRRYSDYAGFDADRKLEFISQLSYILTVDAKTLVFDESTLRDAYALMHKEFGLPLNQCEDVIGEIESHSGLIVEGSYRQYEVAHKSLQEFLAADYIMRLPSVRLISNRASLLPDELAIATALSSRPSAYLGELFFGVLAEAKIEQVWYSVFLARLSMEKPDLRAAHSPEAALAALALLTAVENPAPYVDLFAPLMPTNMDGMLSHQYLMASRSADYKHYERVRKHDSLVLPRVLRVPIAYMP